MEDTDRCMRIRWYGDWIVYKVGGATTVFSDRCAAIRLARMRGQCKKLFELISHATVGAITGYGQCYLALSLFIHAL